MMTLALESSEKVIILRFYYHLGIEITNFVVQLSYRRLPSLSRFLTQREKGSSVGCRSLFAIRLKTDYFKSLTDVFF